MKNVDVIIIGSGAAGITAGIYLKRSSHSCLILDKGAPGGKLLNIHEIDNYPSLPLVSGPELAAKLYGKALEMGIECQYGMVESINKTDEGFIVKTDDGDYECRAIIVATGISFKSSSVKDEKKFIGRGVSYCATCDGRFYKDRPVAVLGNDDMAVEEATYLAALCSKVYVVSPNELVAPKAHLEALTSFPSVSLIKNNGVSLIGSDVISGLLLDDGSTLDVDAVFPLNGEKEAASFLYLSGIEMNHGFIKVDGEMKTSIPGVWAAGDCVDKKLRQVVTAEADGAIAATSAISYLNSLNK